MITTLVNTSGSIQLLSFLSEEHLSEFLQTNSILNKDWKIVDLGEFPGASLWPSCFSFEPNGEDHPNIFFDFNLAKELANNLLSRLYSQRKASFGKNISPLELTLELSLPEEERSPEVKEYLSNMDQVKQENLVLQLQIQEAESCPDLNETVEEARTLWEIPIQSNLNN